MFEITEPIYIPTYVWRYQAEDGDGYDYRVLAVGEWLDERPEGMSDQDYSNMQTVWRASAPRPSKSALAFKK